MPSLKVEIPPGVVKSESKMAASGRYVASSNIRWVRNRAQKIGGNERITVSAMSGTVRGMMGWSDGTIRQLFGAGTEQKLYAIPNTDYTPINITPFAQTSSLVNGFATTSGLATVTVTFASHGALVNQEIYITGPVAFNNVTLDGSYTIQSIVNTNSFTITASTNANATGSNAGTTTVGIEIEDGVTDPALGFGWGAGTWGSSTWGTARLTSGITVTNRTWFLQAFGKILLASYNRGSLYSWDPTVAPVVRAAKVTDTPYYPTKMNGFFVTAERFVIAFGTDSATPGTQDLLEVWSSGQGDYTDWDYSATAGAIGAPSKKTRLAKGKQVVAGADLGKLVSVIWTDAALYIMQYTGSSFVFNTRFIGENCGLSGPLAFTVVNGTAYWCSESAFWQFGDSGLMKIPNSEDYAEWVFKQVRRGFLVKTLATFDSRYAEISFEFVVDNNTEPTLSVVYNYEGKFWFSNMRTRTSGARLAGLDHPYLASTDGYIYKHESTLNDNGATLDWSMESAPFQIGEGDVFMSVDKLNMDTQRQVGDVTYTFTAYDGTPATATAIDSSVNVVSATETAINPRISGRQMSISMSGSGLGCDFRMGVPRALISPNGGR